MKVEPAGLPGVLWIRPDVHEDARGQFLETWSAERYRAAGIEADFVQDNVSRSRRDTLRGLHLQHPHGQGKLVQVLEGTVFDVAVDVRVGSPAFGQVLAATLTDADRSQLWLPPGFAHGFCVTSEQALVLYKCTEPYRPGCEIGLAWNDPDLAIAWPVDRPLLSDRDAAHPRLRDVPQDRLPGYDPASARTEL